MTPLFISKSCSFATIKFSPSHEYIKIDGQVGTVGITEHAATALGDVVYVELPAVGATVTAGESFGSVESVKAASDVYAPVSGEVLEVNSVSHLKIFYAYILMLQRYQNLETSPGEINKSALGSGWFIKIKVAQ
jgi:glycine cleavage system H protein